MSEPTLPANLPPPLPVIRPRRLQAGDTIGLINPSGAIHERAPFEQTHRALSALGFRVQEAPNARARYGHMAGTPQQRADDIHTLFADPAVAGVLAVTGGSGANRVLPLLDYGLIGRNPKFLGGFSDLTALISAVHVKTGLVTFHSPLGRSDWNAFSTEHFKALLMDGQAATLPLPSTAMPAEAEAVSTLRSGQARGPLQGGNLAVLTSLAGTPFMPRLDGAILFLEDVNEYIYRVDRMLSTLMLSGDLARVAGVVLGGFTNCKPSEGSYGTLTLEEVFDDYFVPLGVPVFRGAPFGHVKHKITLPLGVTVEMDADAGTLRLLEPAVV
ncbi:MAG: LD-carboxypeptidase [Rubrivivax sp.]|nr:LD-carboxypeptidase [Rubrivivax sp.]